MVNWRPIIKYHRPVWQSARHPQNPNKVPFDAILPMALKDRGEIYAIVMILVGLLIFVIFNSCF